MNKEGKEKDLSLERPDLHGVFEVGSLYTTPNYYDRPVPRLYQQESPSPSLEQSKSSKQSKSLEESQSFKSFLHENGTELKIAYSDLEFSNPRKPLGEGTQGAVYLAVYQGKKVAVKEFPVDDSDQEQEAAILSEGAVMAGVQSDFVVQLRGICMEEQKHCLVMEYVPAGDLHQWLEQNKSLNESQTYRLAADIAYGLSILHRGGIIHRDLKSLNVLLFEANGELCAKITDFGLAVLKRYKIQDDDMLVGSIPWLAPEILKSNETRKYSESSDVYSLGMVIYELVTKKVPYYYMPNEPIEKPSPQQVREWVLEGRRPWDWSPLSCHPELANLIKECCAADPKDRPSADRVFSKLTLLYEQAKSAESRITTSISTEQVPAFELEKGLEKTFIFENYFAFYKPANQNKNLPTSNLQPQNSKENFCLTYLNYSKSR